MNTSVKINMLGSAAAMLAAAGVAAASVQVVPPAMGASGPADFPFVGEVGNAMGYDCSGTVVDDGMCSYILTARHCVFNDTETAIRPLADIKFRDANGTEHNAARVSALVNADIAIIKLATRVTSAALGIDQFYCGMDQVGQQFCFTGFGLSGTTGPDRPVGNPARPMFTPGTDAKRTFYNMFDTRGAGPLHMQGTVLGYDLDDPATLGNPNGAIDGEGLTGPGDSGGGYFIEVGGTMYLAAVHSSGTRPFYGGQASAIPVSDYKDWIFATIPTPGTVTLAGLALIAGVKRRRAA